MKQRAFVVKLSIDENTNDFDLAEAILDAVEDAGFKVLSVNPFGGDESGIATPQGPITNPPATASQWGSHELL